MNTKIKFIYLSMMSESGVGLRNCALGRINLNKPLYLDPEQYPLTHSVYKFINKYKQKPIKRHIY